MASWCCAVLNLLVVAVPVVLLARAEEPPPPPPDRTEELATDLVMLERRVRALEQPGGCQGLLCQVRPSPTSRLRGAKCCRRRAAAPAASRNRSGGCIALAGPRSAVLRARRSVLRGARSGGAVAVAALAEQLFGCDPLGIAFDSRLRASR